MVGGLSIVFTREVVVKETFFRKGTILCKSKTCIDAGQFYLYSMCQSMPTSFYTRWEYQSESQRFTPCRNKSRPSRIWSFHNFHEIDRPVELTTMLLLVDKKIFCLNRISNHCNTVFEAIRCCFHYRSLSSSRRAPAFNWCRNREDSQQEATR